MKKPLAITTATLLLASGSAIAGDAAKGEGLYNSKGCVGCHGVGGKSNNEQVYPSLIGKTEAFIVAEIKKFKSGERKNPMMSPMAQMVTDAEAADIGAFLGTKK